MGKNKKKKIPNPKVEITCVKQLDQMDIEILFDIKKKYVDNSRQKTQCKSKGVPS